MGPLRDIVIEIPEKLGHIMILPTGPYRLDCRIGTTKYVQIVHVVGTINNNSLNINF
jgi:hypothetical protein